MNTKIVALRTPARLATVRSAKRRSLDRAIPSVRIAHYTSDMTFRVILEHDPETGDYSAVCPELPGCASAGETEAEASANIREAIELYLKPGDIDLPEDAKLFEVTVG
jgi:predicted RNase H-like HicB family nuclease